MLVGRNLVAATPWRGVRAQWAAMGMRVIRVTVAGALAAASCLAAAACTSTTEGHPAQAGPSTSSSAPGQQADGPKVAKDVLTKMVTDQLGKGGVTPQAVDCPQDLMSQVGQKAVCAITISPVNGFQITVTVTGVNGTELNYAMSPSVSKSQLEVAVSDMINRSTKTVPDSVSCESDLDGKVGATASCAVTVAGATTQQAVVVRQVQGLVMEYGLLAAPGGDPAQPPGGGPQLPGGGPVLAPNGGAGGTGGTLPKAIAEGALLAQLRQSGQAPDSASCAGDMPIAVGATLPCTAITAGRGQNYVLTVSSVVNGSATFKVTPAQ